MSLQRPLVSVIALCYNHAPYVAEALASVWQQTYPRVELIVVDDASTDGSQQIIRKALAAHPDVPFIAMEENRGNCYAFNQGLALAKGDWVIDLATDDLLMPERISRQIALAQSLPKDYGVIFSDAWLLDEKGREQTFYRRDEEGNLLEDVPQGDVFPDLLRHAFICTPTMLMRKTMLEELNGYDESLSYEDYDFWVRSGSNWKYAFQDDILTKKRVLSNSHGQSFYRKSHSSHLESTLKICRKALKLVESPEEKAALAVSVRYHLRQALWMECFGLVFAFGEVLKQIDRLSLLDKLWLGLAHWRVPLYEGYMGYLKLRNRFR